MEIQRLKIKDLAQNKGQIPGLPTNPRQWTREEIDKIARSLKETPELFEARPIIVTPWEGKFIILGGNLRFAGCKANKDKDAPCIVIPEGTPVDKMKEIVIKDNGSFGAWDYDALANLWDDLPLTAWGVPAWEQRNAEQAQNQGEGGTGGEGGKEQHQCENREDNTDGMTVEKRAFPGAIFALDGHRLMCGDATDPAAYDALLKAAGVDAVDLALTDPPYGISVVEKGGKVGGSKRIQGRDILKKGDVRQGDVLIKSAYAPVAGDDSTDTARAAFAIMKECSAAQVIFGGNYFTDFLPPSRCWIVWDKVNGETDFADVELAWASIDKSARLFKHLWNGAMRAGDHEAEGRTRLHPTQKPVGLLTAIVEKLFPDAQTILDPFGGSGSTLIAADRLGKRCFMMELSVDYVDVILARWERFTGKKAELLNPAEKVPQS